MSQDWNTVMISKTRPTVTRGQKNAATAAAQRTVRTIALLGSVCGGFSLIVAVYIRWQVIGTTSKRYRCSAGDAQAHQRSEDTTEQ